MKGIAPVMLETVAAVPEAIEGRETGRWLIVKMVIDRMTGFMNPVPIEGELSYASEGLASQRASALAIEIGDAKAAPKRERAKKSKRKFNVNQRQGRRKGNKAHANAGDSMSLSIFLGENEDD